MPPSATHTLREMALRQVIENETSSNDCFQFTTDGFSDARLVEHQYAKFKVNSLKLVYRCVRNFSVYILASGKKPNLLYTHFC